MKHSKKLLAAALLAFLLPAPAGATSISYLGNYTFSDDLLADGFRETLTFSNPFGPNSGIISGWNPSDPVFDDAGLETLIVAPLTLDSGDYSVGSYFAFAPTTYVGGFAVADDDGSILMTADLNVENIRINLSTATINSYLAINLTNITAGAGYVLGASEVIDAFLVSSTGGASFTFQFAGDISDAIVSSTSGSSFGSTYSGTARSIAEPGALAAFGFGLVAFGLFCRRRFV